MKNNTSRRDHSSSSVTSSIILVFCLFIWTTNGLFLDVKPKWNEWDKIEVWFLGDPLPTYPDGRSPMSSLSSMRGALGFINRNTQVENRYILVEYAINTSNLTDSLFPVLLADKQPELMWQSQSDVSVTNGFDISSWTNSLYIMEISGDMFYRYLCWIPNYVKANGTYQLFTIQTPAFLSSSSSSSSSKNNNNNNKQLVGDGIHFLSSSTAYDFVWESFEALWNLGASVQLVDTEPFPLRNNIVLYVPNAPQQVNYEQNKQAILQFYQNFQYTNSSMSLQSVIMTAVTQNNGSFYYFDNYNYYVMNLIDPWIQVYYLPVKFAENHRDRKLVPMSNECPFKPIGRRTISVGGVFVIITLLLFAMYCMFGTIYKSTQTKSKGWERMPNYQFWTSLFTYTKIGVLFVFTRITYCAVMRKAKDQHTNNSEGSSLLNNNNL